MSDALSLVDPKHIVMLQNRPHPTYPGVLEAAIKAGLLELTVKMIQAPTPENGNTAICEAMATFPGPDGRERIFAEVGDANPGNVNRMIAPHVLRMSATRAKGRALRDALGIGVALVEEMAGENEREDRVARPPANGKPNGAAPANSRRPETDERGPAVGTKGGLVADAAAGETFCAVAGCGAEIGPAEMSASLQRGWDPHCKRCGYERNMRERAERSAAPA